MTQIETKARQLYQADCNNAMRFNSAFPFVACVATDYRRTALRVYVTPFDDLPAEVKLGYMRRAGKRLKN